MDTKKCGTALVMGLILLLTLGVFCIPATADEPAGTLRYFALVLPVGATPDDIPDLCPDLEGADSRLLVVHPAGNDLNPNGTGLTFMSSSARLSGEPATATYECDGKIYEVGETWVLARDVTHATSAGSETLTLLWKDELPPAGALAFTGPVPEGGKALFFDWFWVRPGEPDDTDNSFCDPWLNRSFASKQRTANTRLWCIGAGYFSK